MRRVSIWRALTALLAAGTVTAGLAGAYSYGQAYALHRGFAPVARVAGARMGRLVTVHFYSRALHRQTDYLVYLPPGYSRANRYPVYYLLHGAPGAPDAFISIVNLDVRLSNRLSERQLRPMILVFPDGRIAGNTFSDSEWANTAAGNFESYVIDVVRDVDHRFATIPSRQDRLIGGYSAGAYGAINIALHQLSTFANVQVWSGYFLQTRTGVFGRASRATLAYNSPLDYARTLRAAIALNPLRAYMFVGRADPASSQIAPMARQLAADGASVSYSIFPGGHDWQVWYSRVDRLLIMASQMVSQALPAPVALPARATRLTRPAAPARAAATQRARRARASTQPRRSIGPPLSAAGTPPSGHARGHASRWLGLVLALVSAALINLGFLLQHRGLRSITQDGTRALLTALRNRTWLAGQALGWVGFGAQIMAVAIAPLSLVQAFAAGGLVLSVPLAAGLFRYRISRTQLVAVAGMALALAVLPLGVPRSGAHVASTTVIAGVALASAAALTIARRPRPASRAIAAGLIYGVADAAVKAVANGVRVHGSGAMLSGWAAVAAVATFGGFLAFQTALRRGNAVSSVSLMTALTALTALAFGVLGFGESLGANATTSLLHLLAIAVVLACVPVLAAAQHDLADKPAPDRPLGRVWRALRVVGAGGGAAVALVVSVLVGTGLLYGLRGLGWFSLGPPVGDALPLLQLSGLDVQPVCRVGVAWVLAGVVFGLAVIRVRPLRRALPAGLLGLVLLLFASDASFALARNLRLTDVLQSHVPGLGAWLEAALFAVGAAVPGWIRLSAPRQMWRIVCARPLLPDRAS